MIKGLRIPIAIGIDALPTIPVKTSFGISSIAFAWRLTMRFCLLIIFSLMAIGCNSDPRCRRETALLRAEILDLEDKYYLLKSENESLLASQGISSETYLGESYPSDSYLGNQSFEQPQAYYTDTGEPYYPMVDGEQLVADEITYEDQQPNADINLAPDDSITPLMGDQIQGNRLDSVDDATSIVQLDAPANDNDLLYNATSRTPEPDWLDPSSDMNLLLDAPEVSSIDMEIGYDQSKPILDVTEVVINRSASMGHDTDGYPGDEGLDLLIQTRTADGRNELVAGDLTVSVIDPEQTGERQRIGLWKFLSEETKLFFANNELESYGILLHLPWEQQTPVSKKLMVHVRFSTPDGREMTTSSEIRITPPPGDYSPNEPSVIGWTKRDSRWISGTGTRMRSPRPRAVTNPRNVRWQRGNSSNQARSATPTVQRTTPAVPTKAQIRKPAWRPIR